MTGKPRRHGRDTAGGPWSTAVVDSADGHVRVLILNGGEPISWRRFLAALVDDAGCRAALTQQLVGLPDEQIYWETPALIDSLLDDASTYPAEYVAVSARLRQPPALRAFSAHFGPDPVVTFTNLGGDATLVVPTPIDEQADYRYLLPFLRTAPPDQIDALWGAVGRAMRQRVGERPVWLSTSGGGVAWLHVRLDDRPKYYSHAPYRAEPPGPAGTAGGVMPPPV